MADDVKVQDDPRFADVKDNSGNAVKLSDGGIAKLEEIGDNLVRVTDRDGRISIHPIGDTEPANMTAEQRQAATDAAIDASPVRNDLSPGHSDFNPDASIVASPAEVPNQTVVNKGLGVDESSSTTSTPKAN